MTHNKFVMEECSTVLNNVIDKVVLAADRGVPIHVDKSRSAAAPGMPRYSDVVQGFQKKLRPTAPAFQPSPRLNANAAEFRPVKCENMIASSAAASIQAHSEPQSQSG